MDHNPHAVLRMGYSTAAMITSYLNIGNTIDSLPLCFFIKLGRHVDNDAMKNPINFGCQGQYFELDTYTLDYKYEVQRSMVREVCHLLMFFYNFKTVYKPYFQQRTLTPPDTWSCPIWDLHLFWCWDHSFLNLSCLRTFWVSNIPRYFYFAFQNNC